MKNNRFTCVQHNPRADGDAIVLLAKTEVSGAHVHGAIAGISNLAGGGRGEFHAVHEHVVVSDCGEFARGCHPIEANTVLGPLGLLLQLVLVIMSVNIRD